MKWRLTIWRWLSSRTYRAALDEYRRTRTQLRRQRDLIPAAGATAIQAGLSRLRQVIVTGEPPAVVGAAREELRINAYSWLEDPRHNRLKDYTEMALTAIVVVMVVRTFFAQPMQVPTASMQPTLYGVTIKNLLAAPGAEIPPWWRQIWERVIYGRSYYHLVARTPGKFVKAEPPKPVQRWLGWLTRLREQRFLIGTEWYSVLLPGMELPNPYGLPAEYVFLSLAGLNPEHVYQPGEDMVKLAVTTGDHILIDRFSINFRRPQRGEIVVFAAQEVPRLRQNDYYLKRLVALGGDTVQIGDDRHLRINGVRLDSTTPHFDEIYSFRGPPVDGEYSGHINDRMAQRLRMKRGFLAPLFPNGNTVRRVDPHQIMVMGDNTVTSYDSRAFGELPESAIVGRLLAVYWPLSPRFGFSVD